MNVNQILKQAQEVKSAMDKVLEHTTDWDEAPDEEALAQREPEAYDLHVNGIRRIHVKEGDGEHVIWNVAPYGLITKYDRHLI